MTGDRPYADSVVVTETVRVVVPFVLTFGIFTTLHGTKSVGGGFQGGVVVGAAVVTLAFAFGIRQTRSVLGTEALLWGAAGGLVVFAVVATSSLLLGGTFLDASGYARLPVSKAVVYAVESVEVGIGITVASVIVLLFFRIAGGQT
jgi:multicomponent Na+:H+ antiporter subunit B